MSQQLHPTLALGIGDDEKVVVIFAIVAFVVVVWIIAATIFYTFKARAREQTKRELAAYVAEGSISPDDAAKLLSADEDEVRKKIADGVAWGVIKPKDAHALIISASSRPSPPAR